MVTGRPADEISNTIESGRFTLVAIVTHGRGALGKSVLGSVTDGVVRKSPVPALVVRPKARHEYEKVGAVLVPRAGSPVAESALPLVEDLATRLSTRVSLLRVATMPSAAEPYSVALLAASHLDVDERVEL